MCKVAALVLLVATALLSAASPVEKRETGGVSAPARSTETKKLISWAPDPHLSRPQRHRKVLLPGLPGGYVLQPAGRLPPERGYVRAGRRGLLLLPVHHGLRRSLHVAHGVHVRRRQLRLRQQVQLDSDRLGQVHLELRVPPEHDH